MLTIGILLFDQVEVLDFAGPFEVLSTASRVALRAGAPAPFKAVLIGQSGAVVHARAGLRVTPDHDLGSHPPLDVLLVPGGDVTEVLKEADVIRWVKATSEAARLTASVCTGAFLLGAAGLIDGRRVTTHWEDVDDLRRACPKTAVETTS